MKTSVLAVAGLTAATVLVGLSATGCSSKSDKPAASSTTAAAAGNSSGAEPRSSDAASSSYVKLLIKPDDIALPGDTFTLSPPTENPNGKPGVAGVFSNQADTREIGDTILILPDAAGAATALDGAKPALSGNVTGDPQPAAVGESGTIVQSTSPDGSKSVTVLLFTEGKAFVTLEFDGKPDDPVPPAFATDIGQKQAAAIKSGLAG